MEERMKVPGLEAVVNAARSLGSNGRGKGGVGGYMVAMAQQPKRFAPLLEMALQLKNSEWDVGQPFGWRGGEAFESHEQTLARIEKISLDEIVMAYVIYLVRPPLDNGPQSSATDFLEAIIYAAKSQGSNGRGKDGVEGYIRMLAGIGCRTFDDWVIRAMVEQVKGRSPKSREEIEEILRERGVNVNAAYNLASVMKYGRLPPDNASRRVEIEDFWNALRSCDTSRHAASACAPGD